MSVPGDIRIRGDVQMKFLLFFSLLVGAVFCPAAEAQVNCTQASTKLACIIPNQLNLTAPSSQNLGFLNEAVGSQLGDLPLASPASGIIYVIDPKLNLPVPSNDTLGPILTQRAETIGKRKVYLAVTYQFFRFEDIDGLSLKQLPILLILQGGGSVTASNNRLDLTAHQFGLYLTYGLTSRIDISIAIPILDVREQFTSSGREYSSSSPTGQPFSNIVKSGTAAGIGDQVLAIKGTLWKPKQGGLAVGAELRLPTGDAMNFLGTGTMGFKPYISMTYGGRVSPHVNVGYEINGHSTLVTNAQGAEARLPNRLIFSGGADWGVTKRLTLAVDVLAQNVNHAQRVSIANQSTPLLVVPVPTIQPYVATYNRTDASVGIKVKPVGNLVLSGNVTVKLDQAGLRSRWVPFVGMSYTF
jgi:hypothetical protein